MASEETYLAVLKASFDYDPQEDAEDELPIKENQLLFLIERVDESWWKVRVKTDSPDEQGASGLVPAAYVEEAERIAIVKVLYDYDAQQPSELNVQEDEILHVFERDDGWLLVQSQKEGGSVGYVPENYTEEVSDDEGAQETPAPSASRIVIPPSPPRPEYIDPAERVATHKAQADDIQTWAVSEVDKKGKKKKGTLGVGNGAIFFASESDKTPVQKWQTSDIQSSRIEKNKHVHIDIAGPNPASLHFHAGSKDLAEAISKKLESSKALATPQPPSPQAGPSTSRPSPPPEIERPRSAVPKAVHFDSAPVIIPDEPEEEEEPTPHSAEPEYYEPDPEPEPEPQAAVHTEHDGDGEPAVALYDFTADGDDEITIHEGEPLLVLDKDSEEWWKVRNEHGEEGVVPAQYVELASGESAPAAITDEPEEDPDLTAAREAEEAAAREEAERVAEAREREERAERERAEKERKRKQEAETRAKAAAASAEAERRRREQEREKQKEKERAAAEAAEKEEEERRKKANRSSTASDSSAGGNRNSTAGSSSSRRYDRRAPPMGKLRTWHDRTGQFKVEAVFLGYNNEKLRLHKANGVIIEVPAHKMSPEDMQYVEKALKGGRTSPARSEDDEPLESRRKSLLQETPRSAPTKPAQPPKKAPTIDWFDFFLTAGCDVDDCTRYAASFERDKMDASILPDITESIMRSLGLREGDIIRVKKAIETRSGSGFPSLLDEARKEQVRRDEELARKLQAEENNGKRSQAPNLFAGPNGVLKNNTVRRGRPQPSKSLPPAAVDLGSIASASDQIQRSVTPLVSSPATPGPTTPTPPPPRPNSATPAFSGFDDDAWTNRPASTKPLTPTPVAKAASPPAVRPPSAPAAPPPPLAPPAPSVVAQTQSLPNPATNSTTTGQNLAKTTEQDVFDQLARLSQLRVKSPPAAPPAPPPPVARAPPPIPPIITPPAGYSAGMGMGPSPIPIGQHLQAQQTGFLPPANGPRGPFAPVPANQALLQPLIPTTTGFNSFVPTRPQSTPSSFQPQPAPPPIQPSFLSAQPTGYPGAPQSPFSQPINGFSSAPVLAQPTGFNPNFGGNNVGLGTGFNPGLSFPPPVPPLPPMNTSLNGNGFGNLQPTPTGFNPGFNAMPFNNTISPPPPPVPQQPATNTNPANVFAQMKSGTFASDNSSNPQNAGKYDALRPTPSPFTAQPTGFGGYGLGGMPGGYY